MCVAGDKVCDEFCAAAIRGLKRHCERIILSDILEEWRQIFSARRLARNIAIKCGQDSFRSWQVCSYYHVR